MSENVEKPKVEVRVSNDLAAKIRVMEAKLNKVLETIKDHFGINLKDGKASLAVILCIAAAAMGLFLYAARSETPIAQSTSTIFNLVSATNANKDVFQVDKYGSTKIASNLTVAGVITADSYITNGVLVGIAVSNLTYNGIQAFTGITMKGVAGYTGSVTNAGLGKTNIEMFCSGVLTNVVVTP